MKLLSTLNLWEIYKSHIPDVGNWILIQKDENFIRDDLNEKYPTPSSKVPSLYKQLNWNSL